MGRGNASSNISSRKRSERVIFQEINRARRILREINKTNSSSFAISIDETMNITEKRITF